MGSKLTWTELKSNQLLHLPINHYYHKCFWHVSEQTYLSSGDWIKPGCWVIWEDSNLSGGIRFGLVSEILQLVGTYEEQRNCATALCIQEGYLIGQEPLSLLPRILFRSWGELIEMNVSNTHLISFISCTNI